MSGLSHRPMTHGTGLRGSSRVGAFYWVLALRSTAWKVQKRKKEVRLTESAGTFQVHAAQQVHVNKALGRRSGELKLCRAVGLSYSIAGALIVNTTISLLRNGPALIHRRPKKKREDEPSSAYQGMHHGVDVSSRREELESRHCFSFHLGDHLPHVVLYLLC